jgi:two-component system, NarL family, nitrate/nitrite response regulator NarL
MTGPIKVAVIDDHPLFREGVANTIQRSGAVQVIAEGETADEAIEIAKAKLPDIVLLDVSLPGGGVEAARAIVKACPVVKIVMLTVSESEEHVQQAMAAGVHGYVLKGTSGPELINTLRAVARGEYYVTPTFAARILAHTRRPQRATPRDDGNGDLTKREEQILNRVADGLTNKEIAGALQISEKTVKHYMTNILQKLQVRNRVEAAMEYRKRMQGA